MDIYVHASRNPYCPRDSYVNSHRASRAIMEWMAATTRAAATIIVLIFMCVYLSLSIYIYIYMLTYYIIL